jgi:NAD(P) transhydrogenase subunit alpha
MPTVFIPRETGTDETRVAAAPDSVKKILKLGYKVVVEAGAGTGSGFSDEAFQAAGATVSDDPRAQFAAADVVIKLHPPRPNETAGGHEAELIKEGAVLVSFLFPHGNLDVVETLRRRKVTAFAMDQIPRITRAQSMDALSSQANLAGYKAVLMGADALGKLFPLLMTAAGTIPPAKVVILGAGVAGLQAIATAKRLGAVVEVSDIRPAVKEQVLSLGAKFIEVETTENMETEGGYAKEASEEFLRKQREVVDKHIAEADVVISTAQVPGKKAPVLITGEVVKRMHPGSVIVDLAAEQGGNCELTEPGQVVEKHGITIIGRLNVPALVPVNASEVYARNVVHVLELLTDKEGALKIDLEDEILAGSVVVHGGEVRMKGVAEAASAGGKA